VGNDCDPRVRISRKMASWTPRFTSAGERLKCMEGFRKLYPALFIAALLTYFSLSTLTIPCLCRVMIVAMLLIALSSGCNPFLAVRQVVGVFIVLQRVGVLTFNPVTLNNKPSFLSEWAIERGAGPLVSVAFGSEVVQAEVASTHVLYSSAAFTTDHMVSYTEIIFPTRLSAVKDELFGLELGPSRAIFAGRSRHFSAPFFLCFAQRARTALRAISDLRAGVSDRALAGPPFFPSSDRACLSSFLFMRPLWGTLLLDVK
jgi:hypothetical protein